MAAVSAFNHFPCKTLSANAATQRSLVSKRSLAIVPSSDLAGEVAGSRRYAIAVQNRGVRPVLRIRAAAGDEFETAVAVEEEEKPKQSDEVEELKKSLVASFYGTDRGLRSSSETRAEIVELIHQLEALNPTPAPTDALTRLNGKWILAYTLFPGLFPLFSTPPTFVKVDEISQTIDSENFTVQNSVKFTGPLATTSLTTNAKFEIRSPKRVQLKFEEGIIGTPQLTNSIEIPENVNVLGQKIELAPFKGLITPFQSTASSVAKTISNQSPLKIPVTNANAESWLLTTYLDDELRISKGDGGTVFVLIKEGSSLLS